MDQLLNRVHFNELKFIGIQLSWINSMNLIKTNHSFNLRIFTLIILLFQQQIFV